MIELDATPRTVAVPDDLAATLAGSVDLTDPRTRATPGKAPRRIATSYDGTGSCRRDISPSSAARSASRLVPATS